MKDHFLVKVNAFGVVSTLLVLPLFTSCNSDGGASVTDLADDEVMDYSSVGNEIQDLVPSDSPPSETTLDATPIDAPPTSPAAATTEAITTDAPVVAPVSTPVSTPVSAPEPISPLTNGATPVAAPDTSLPETGELLPPANPVVSLSWVAPAEREDGTPIAMSEIAGYRVYYGTVPGNYTHQVYIADSVTMQVTLGDLAKGTYYIAVTAVDVDGRESELSRQVVRSI